MTSSASRLGRATFQTFGPVPELLQAFALKGFRVQGLGLGFRDRRYGADFWMGCTGGHRRCRADLWSRGRLLSGLFLVISLWRV